MKIAIIGLGGIGGYIGAKLSHYYESNPSVDIYFIARGEHLKVIQNNGLKLITPHQTFVTHPKLATDNTEECPEMDYIFYCTKSYDVENGAKTITPLLRSDTIIIPILNGVDGIEKLKNLLQNNIVCNGLAFIVSKIIEPGVIEETTQKNFYYFGDGNKDTEQLKLIEQMCQNAEINLTYSHDIMRRVWEKFEFISAIASITTAYNITYGEVINNETHHTEIYNLLTEFEQVACAKKVLEPSSSRVKNILSRIKTVPGDSTTSMQRDFWSRKNSEIESLTHYVIIEAKKLGIKTPQYDAIYEIMLKNINVVG